MNKKREREAINNIKLEGYTLDAKSSKIMVSIDCGSTETRSSVFSRENLPSTHNVIAVESGYSKVEDDVSNVRSNSGCLGDNLDMVLRDLTKYKGDKVFEEIHILKGSLMRNTNLPVEKISSNQSKAGQEQTYVNVLSNIAIRLFESVSKSDKLYKRYVVDLTVALPTRDTQSEKRLQKFKKALAGEYSVEFVRDNLTVYFSLSESDIYTEDESQAAMRYWVVVNSNDEEKGYNRVLIIDGGGSTVDFSLLENGVINPRGSKTVAFGGTNFINNVIDSYVKTNDDDRPANKMIIESLDTGLMQNGNDFIDITESIKKAKIVNAKSIMNSINELLDVTELKPTQINAIIACGGLFKETANPQNKVRSLYKFIQKMYAKNSPNTLFSRVTEEFSIVYGLAYYRISE